MDIPEKDPTTYSLFTYLWVLGMSFLGGSASYFKKIKEGHVRVFCICEYVGELVISALSGMVTFFLCQHAQLDPTLSAAFVGIAGHMGSRAISLLEKLFIDKIQK